MNKQNSNTEAPLNLGKIATVFIVCAIISFVTAWYYSLSKEKLTLPSNNGVLGPIYVHKYKESYNISVKINIPEQAWSFVEGEVLDKDMEYLFSFGKELWHETGRDSEGRWREIKNSYDINVTFPNPGNYYVKFKTEGSSSGHQLLVNISRKNGSSLPHLWLGIITLLIGIFLNELKNRTIRNIMDNT